MSSRFDEQDGTLLCGIDDKPCEVTLAIERVLPASRRLPMLESFADRLPCDRCRVSERDASGLGGLRLGRTERRVLLDAAATSASHGTEVTRDACTHAEQEAILRAVRKLLRAGLVQVGRLRTVERRQGHAWGHQTRLAWRSPLGEELVARYCRELESGGRIRWDHRVVDAARATRLDVLGLVAEFGRALSVANEDGSGRPADLSTLQRAVIDVLLGQHQQTAA